MKVSSQDSIEFFVQEYLRGRLTLYELAGKVDDIEWTADQDQATQGHSGLLELYLTEIDEGVRTEKELKEALQTALVGLAPHVS